MRQVGADTRAYPDVFAPEPMVYCFSSCCCAATSVFNEAADDGFDIYDVENGILTGRVRRTWSHEGKYEVIGVALDGRPIGAVCRITLTIGLWTNFSSDSAP
jgi:hypothetical protein